MRGERREARRAFGCAGRALTPVGGGEQCRIGFQPVPRDHCTWPVKSAATWECLKVVNQSMQNKGWKPMLHCASSTLTGEFQDLRRTVLWLTCLLPISLILLNATPTRRQDPLSQFQSFYALTFYGRAMPDHAGARPYRADAGTRRSAPSRLSPLTSHLSPIISVATQSLAPHSTETFEHAPGSETEYPSSV